MEIEKIKKQQQKDKIIKQNGFLMPPHPLINFEIQRFEVEHILEEIKTFIGNKNIKTNIFRIQAYDSIMCGYFCIRFIDFMLAGKTLTDLTNLFK